MYGCPLFTNYKEMECVPKRYVMSYRNNQTAEQLVIKPESNGKLYRISQIYKKALIFLYKYGIMLLNKNVSLISANIGE